MTASIRQILAISLLLLLMLGGGFARIAPQILPSATAQLHEHCDPSKGPLPGNHNCADGCPICQGLFEDLALPLDAAVYSLLRREPERLSAVLESCGATHAVIGRTHRARAPPLRVLV